MVDLILLPLAFFAITTVLGMATIAPLRSGYRRVMLPAAPVVGAALIAVVLSATSWFMAAGSGMLVVVLVAVASIVVAVRRGKRFWAVGLPAAATAAGCWAIGALGAALAMIPNAQLGDSRIVLATSNHDALFYGSVAGWLAEHPMFPFPVVGTSPDQGLAVPAFGAAAFSFTYPLRVGQSMVHAGLTRSVGSDVMTTLMPVMALWVFIVPGAVFVSLRLLRTRTPVALCGSAAVTFSALLIYQVANQNMDSLFGVSLAVLSIGAVVGAAQGRMSRWPAAIVLSALVAVYTEYALFVAPAVLAGLLVRRSRFYLRSLYRSLHVLALAVVIAPTAWYRGAVQLAGFEGSTGDVWPSPFITDGSWAWLNRILGSSTIALDSPLAKTAMLFGVVIALGCVLAVLFGRNRGVWLGLLLVGFAAVTELTLSHKGYTQFRAVILFLPLVVVAATAGWGGWLDFVRRRGWAVVRTMTAVSLALVLMTWTFVNVRTVRAQIDPVFAAGRHIGAEYEEAAQWVAEFGGVDGQDITVLAPDFVQNIALNLYLRDFDKVSYPMENANYLYVNEFWDGRDDPYLIVGTGTQVDVPRSAIIRSNDKFTLIDRRVSGGTVIAPIDLTGWSWFAQPDGSFLGGYGSDVLVLRSGPDSGTATIELAGSGAATVPVDVTGQDGGGEVSAELGPAPQPVPLPDPERTMLILTLEEPENADQSAPIQIRLPHLLNAN